MTTTPSPSATGGGASQPPMNVNSMKNEDSNWNKVEMVAATVTGIFCAVCCISLVTAALACVIVPTSGALILGALTSSLICGAAGFVALTVLLCVTFRKNPVAGAIFLLGATSNALRPRFYFSPGRPGFHHHHHHHQHGRCGRRGWC